jgi:hypothetical protein
MSSTIEASPPSSSSDPVAVTPPLPAHPARMPWLARSWATVRTAISGHVYHLLVLTAIGLGGTIFFSGPLSGNVERLRLVFLAVAALLLVLSLFRVSDDLRISTLHIAPPATINLFLCFAFGFLLSRGEHPEATLVYILGFAALIIGGQHLVEFHRTEETIRTLDRQLAQTGRQLTEQLASSETRIGELNRGLQARIENQMITLRYEKYREQVTRAYTSAERRVVAAASHWPIDPQFWDSPKKDLTLEDDAFWDAQEVYRNLSAALQRSWDAPEGKRLQIVFAGRLDVVPTMETAPALSKDDFTLFMGVLWRLALARRLRKAVDTPADSTAAPVRADVRVFVADIPINAHVIDDDVYLLRSKPGDGHESSMGIKIADGNNAENPGRASDVETADTFAQMIERYTRRTVRSAREYAASLLVFAAVSRGEPRDLELLDEKGYPETATIRKLLETLGMEQWARQGNGGLGDAVRVDADQLCRRATELTGYFLQHYYPDRKLVKLPSRARYWEQRDNVDRVTVDRLIDDII